MSSIDIKRKEVISKLEHDCHLDFRSPVENLRMTNLICTIGPSCQDTEILVGMLKAGMNIARVNMSHEDREQHQVYIDNLREAAKQRSDELGYNCHLGIALDLKGMEIRTGSIEKEGVVEWTRGDIVKLTINSDLANKCNREVMYVSYRNIIYETRIGSRVFIDDYRIVLEISEIGVDCLLCLVLVGGVLGSNKLVTVPDLNFEGPSITEHDSHDIEFAIENKVEFIMVSKVKNAEAIKEVRKILGEKGKQIKLITKIENLAALENIEQIITATDAILIARADLCIELKPSKVFLVQKAITARCNRVGRPVVCGTEMLMSMVHRPQALRSDISDISNAILDGADAIMLSSETALGDFPVEAVQTAAYSAREAEAALWFRNFFEEMVANNPSVIDAAHSIAISAVRSAKSSLATAIIVLTVSGRSAQLVSMYRPPCPIVAATRCIRVARQMHICRGLFPVLVPEKRCTDFSYDTDIQVQYTMAAAYQMNIIHNGDPVVVVSTWKGGPGFTNTIRIIYADYDTDIQDCPVLKPVKSNRNSLKH